MGIEIAPDYEAIIWWNTTKFFFSFIPEFLFLGSGSSDLRGIEGENMPDWITEGGFYTDEPVSIAGYFDDIFSQFMPNQYADSFSKIQILLFRWKYVSQCFLAAESESAISFL